MTTDESTSNPDTTSLTSKWWKSARQARIAGYVTGIVLTIGLISASFWLAIIFKRNAPVIGVNAESAVSTPVATELPISLQRPIVTESGLVDRSGVRLVQVAITGGGGLIDLRFQVVDPDKANAVHEENNPPTIVDGATGLIVNQLLMGHTHSGRYTAGQTYYLIFENPGNIVQSGNKVSILLGDAEVDNIIVK